MGRGPGRPRREKVAVAIPTAKVFSPLLRRGRYQGAYGGRGSGKSHFMAGLCVEDSFEHGTRGLCVREVQKSIKDSAKRLIEDKIAEFKAPGFRSLESETRTPGGGVILYIGMKDQTAHSIQSLEGIDWVWVEQAEVLSARSLQMLRPTIRKAGSRMRFTWNPRRESDPVDQLFRGPAAFEGAVSVRANWSDNPWFTAELEAERQHDLAHSPTYRHVWEGEYATVVEGAYYAQALAQAGSEGRITPLTYDPILERRAYWDLGYDDATTIWVAQFKGQRIYAMDYIEGSGQELGHYVGELRRRGHGDALCVLPHDGDHHHVGKSVREHLNEAGFRTRVVRHGGRGAAHARIEAARRVFPRIWFNEEACKGGLEALGAYHERRDDERQIGLGPEHDWCLAAATMVLTPDGWRPVEALGVHDQVLTPCGVRRIVRSGVVRITDRWVEVKGVLVTPEHRFFTNRGLVEAGALSRSDKLWTQESLGLRILGLLSAILRSGFMDAITSATPRARGRDARCSFIGWSMRLCTARFRRATRSTTWMTTRSTTIRTTFEPCRASSIAASTNRNPAISSPAGFAARRSVVTSVSPPDAAFPAAGSTAPPRNDAAAPAYNLSIDRDSCYFVRGDDGNAYLVSNSSHAADSFGLMCQMYEEPNALTKPEPAKPMPAESGAAGWMAN